MNTAAITQTKRLTDAERDNVARVLADVDGLLGEVVCRYAPRLNRHDREDCLQEMRIHVLLSLPNFDAARGHKLSTFVYGCCCRFMCDWLRSQRRQHAHLDLGGIPDLPAPDFFQDRHIEQLADAILADPCGTLGGVCTEVVVDAGADFDKLVTATGSKQNAAKYRHRTKQRILAYAEEHLI